MAIWDRDENWLGEIAASDHPNHSIRGNLGDLTAEMVQASFDVTYGKNRFKATNHGTVITVWSNLGYIALLGRHAENARKRGDAAREAKLMASITEVQTKL